MEKILTATVDEKDTFEVWGTLNKDYLFDSDFEKVTVNGESKDDFGSYWSGARITADDCAEMLIRAFINNAEDIEFAYIHPVFEDYKRNTITHKLVGPEMPDQFVAKYGYIAHLAAYTDGCLYFLDNEGHEVFLVTDRKYNVLTSYENFFVNAIVDDYKNGELKFVEGVFNASEVETWVKEYLE